MDLVGADVLRDATGLAGGDLGLADRVQQRRLAVVDVAHDRHDRRALDEILVGVVVLDLDIGVVAQRDDLDLLVERVGDGLDLVVGQGLGDHRQHAHGHELLDDVGDRDAEVLGDVLDRRAGVDPDRVDPRQLIGGQHVRRVRHRRAAATPATARRALRRRAGARTGTATGGLGVDDDAALAGAGAALAAHPATRGTTGLARGLGLRLVALGALGRLGDRDDPRARAARGRLDVRDQPGRLLVLAVLALGGRGALGVGGCLGGSCGGSLSGRRLGGGRLGRAGRRSSGGWPGSRPTGPGPRSSCGPSAWRRPEPSWPGASAGAAACGASGAACAAGAVVASGACGVISSGATGSGAWTSGVAAAGCGVVRAWPGPLRPIWRRGSTGRSSSTGRRGTGRAGCGVPRPVDWPPRAGAWPGRARARCRFAAVRARAGRDQRGHRLRARAGRDRPAGGRAGHAPRADARERRGWAGPPARARAGRDRRAARRRPERSLFAPRRGLLRRRRWCAGAIAGGLVAAHRAQRVALLHGGGCGLYVKARGLELVENVLAGQSLLLGDLMDSLFCHAVVSILRSLRKSPPVPSGHGSQRGA